MLNFEFQNPVKLLFGKGQVRLLSREIPQGQCVLILSGSSSAEKNGALPAVRKALEGFRFFEFSGIEANPKYETLMKAVSIVTEQNIDYLVAVGGGSVIDGTKFVAAATGYRGSNPWQMMVKNEVPEQVLPFATVLTLPAAGSEMNCYSVISNEQSQEKLSFDSPRLFPQCSVMDPEYTYTLPSQQTSNGIVDTFSHVLEQYLTYPVNSPLQDRMAESILTTLIEEGPRVLNSPKNYEARANLMLCSTLAINDLISVGVPTDWTTHEIGHSLTELFGMDHACTLAVLFPAVLQAKRKEKSTKLLQYAERVWQINVRNDGKKIDLAIEYTRSFFQSLGIKTRICEYGLGESDLAKVIAKIESKGILPLGEHADIDLTAVKQILANSL